MRSFLIITLMALPLAACETTSERVCRDERGLTPGSQAFAECEQAEYNKLVQRVRRHQNIGNK
ncbi:hypothetical protein [Denitrobaculum tricleocarpae]|uniref:Lipoprotein n=1 Tax=Denitrobaculum tricleocarpae TaxID=2591009 RepID=A0A545TKQ5_9PROT|nr:hypothetical protein [Denitrobaculum tricleocarpae]TQV77778.1 hypothetical protein FKG95_19655 [Denitrobaculum tricleocarpae]